MMNDGNKTEVHEIKEGELTVTTIEENNEEKNEERKEETNK